MSTANAFAALASSNEAAPPAMELTETDEYTSEQHGFASLSKDAYLRLSPEPFPAKFPPTRVQLLAISPDGLRYAYATPAGQIGAGSLAEMKQALEALEREPADFAAPQSQQASGTITHLVYTASSLVVATEIHLSLYTHDLQHSASTPLESPLHHLAPNPADESIALLGRNGHLRIDTTAIADACTAMAWSQRGKQIIVGHADGYLRQYTPSGELKASLPPPSTDSGEVNAVSWLENNLFCVTYSSGDDDVDVYLLRRTTNPDALHYTKVMNPSLPFGDTSHPPFYSLLPLSKTLVLTACTTSADLGLISLPHNASLSFDDKAFFRFSSARDAEVSVVGLAVQTLGTEKFVWVLDNDGCIKAWSIRDQEHSLVDEALQGTQQVSSTAAPGPTTAVASPFGAATGASPFGNAAAASSPFAAASSPFAAGNTASAFGVTAGASPFASSAFGGNSAFGNHQQAKTSAFGTSSAFGGVQQQATAPAFGTGSGFGMSTTATPAFGGFGQTSAFGTPSAFGQAPAQASDTTASASGTTMAPAAFAKSAFGAHAFPAANASAFGGFPAAATTVPTQTQQPARRPAHVELLMDSDNEDDDEDIQQDKLAAMDEREPETQSSANVFAGMGGLGFGSQAPVSSAFAQPSQSAAPAQPSVSESPPPSAFGKPGGFSFPAAQAGGFGASTSSAFGSASTNPFGKPAGQATTGGSMASFGFGFGQGQPESSTQAQMQKPSAFAFVPESKPPSAGSAMDVQGQADTLSARAPAPPVEEDAPLPPSTPPPTQKATLPSMPASAPAPPVEDDAPLPPSTPPPTQKVTLPSVPASAPAPSVEDDAPLPPSTPPPTQDVTLPSMPASAPAPPVEDDAPLPPSTPPPTQNVTLPSIPVSAPAPPVEKDDASKRRPTSADKAAPPSVDSAKSFTFSIDSSSSASASTLEAKPTTTSPATATKDEIKQMPPFSFAAVPDIPTSTPAQDSGDDFTHFSDEEDEEDEEDYEDVEGEMDEALSGSDADEHTESGSEEDGSDDDDEDAHSEATQSADEYEETDSVFRPKAAAFQFASNNASSTASGQQPQQQRSAFQLASDSSDSRPPTGGVFDFRKAADTQTAKPASPFGNLGPSAFNMGGASTSPFAATTTNADSAKKDSPFTFGGQQPAFNFANAAAENASKPEATEKSASKELLTLPSVQSDTEAQPVPALRKETGFSFKAKPLEEAEVQQTTAADKATVPPKASFNFGFTPAPSPAPSQVATPSAKQAAAFNFSAIEEPVLEKTAQKTVTKATSSKESANGKFEAIRSEQPAREQENDNKQVQQQTPEVVPVKQKPVLGSYKTIDAARQPESSEQDEIARQLDLLWQQVQNEAEIVKVNLETTRAFMADSKGFPDSLHHASDLNADALSLLAQAQAIVAQAAQSTDALAQVRSGLVKLEAQQVKIARILRQQTDGALATQAQLSGLGPEHAQHQRALRQSLPAAEKQLDALQAQLSLMQTQLASQDASSFSNGGQALSAPGADNIAAAVGNVARMAEIKAGEIEELQRVLVDASSVGGGTSLSSRPSSGHSELFRTPTRISSFNGLPLSSVSSGRRSASRLHAQSQSRGHTPSASVSLAHRSQLSMDAGGMMRSSLLARSTTTPFPAQRAVGERKRGMYAAIAKQLELRGIVKTVAP